VFPIIGAHVLGMYALVLVVGTLIDRIGRGPALSAGLLVMALSTVALCIGLWIRAKTVDQDERGNAERRALFVGLWPAVFWLIGDGLERREAPPRRALLRRS
jgi:MFS family permease